MSGSKMCCKEKEFGEGDRVVGTLEQVSRAGLFKEVLCEQGPGRCERTSQEKACGKGVLAGRKKGPGEGKTFHA